MIRDYNQNHDRFIYSVVLISWWLFLESNNTKLETTQMHNLQPLEFLSGSQSAPYQKSSKTMITLANKSDGIVLPKLSVTCVTLCDPHWIQQKSSQKFHHHQITVLFTHAWKNSSTLLTSLEHRFISSCRTLGQLDKSCLHLNLSVLLQSWSCRLKP